MNLSRTEQWRRNLDAMEWAVNNVPFRFITTMVDNKYMLATLFEEHHCRGALSYKSEGLGVGSDKGGIYFSYEEINILRQKYNDLCDIAPQTLNENDHLIGDKIKAYCKRVEERGLGLRTTKQTSQSEGIKDD